MANAPDFAVGRDEVGVVTAAAWTPSGGEIMLIEVNLMPGKGSLTLTGQLGDVMQESAQAAMSYIRSRSDALGLERDFYQNIDVHVHFPDFVRAYEPDGMRPEEFITFGPTQRTLAQFIDAGWLLIEGIRLPG